MPDRPRVFVVNEPLRRDRETGEYAGRVMNFAPAAEFGDVVHLLPAGPPGLDPEGVLRTIAARLDAAAPTERDYLLPVGNQSAIVLAVAEFSRRLGGRFRWLHWNGRHGGRSYTPMLVDLDSSLKPIRS